MPGAYKLFMVMKNELYGYIDENGETVVPIKYECATQFREGLACVKDENGWSIIEIIDE